MPILTRFFLGGGGGGRGVHIYPASIQCRATIGPPAKRQWWPAI